jgi:hypothetical protein
LANFKLSPRNTFIIKKSHIIIRNLSSLERGEKISFNKLMLTIQGKTPKITQKLVMSYVLNLHRNRQQFVRQTYK